MKTLKDKIDEWEMNYIKEWIDAGTDVSTAHFGAMLSSVKLQKFIDILSDHLGVIEK